MAEESKKMEDAGKAKDKPVETTSAMPDGSDKSEYKPTGPDQPVAEAEAPAAAAVGEAKAPEEKVKDEVEIQIDLLKDKDWYRRREAAITLGEMGDERAIPLSSPRCAIRSGTSGRRRRTRWPRSVLRPSSRYSRPCGSTRSANSSS